MMRKMFGMLALFCCLVAPSVVRADDAAPSGVRGEILANMMDAGTKLQDLAGAFPDAKYTWKPGKDVRSTGQVFLHVVAANYMLPSLMGVKGPMSMEDLMKLDSQTMEPAKVRQMLKDSYAFATKVITDTPDSDLDGQVEFFGQKMSKRATMLIMASHSHEHLGQAIAYARSNNITPPWTAREQAAAKKAAEAKK
ncbi:MAG: DinB family protein [Candidatus Eisenbacteria bacterium]